MRFNEKMDMFISMAQLKGISAELLTKNILKVGVETFKSDLKNTIKGSLDNNIGKMYDLVEKYANI
jgi:hypothetical protein